MESKQELHQKKVVKDLGTLYLVDHIAVATSSSNTIKSGIIGKLVNFPFQWYPICKDDAFVVWPAHLRSGWDPKKDVPNFPPTEKQSIFCWVFWRYCFLGGVPAGVTAQANLWQILVEGISSISQLHVTRLLELRAVLKPATRTPHFVQEIKHKIANISCLFLVSDRVASHNPPKQHNTIEPIPTGEQPQLFSNRRDVWHIFLGRHPLLSCAVDPANAPSLQMGHC